MIRFFDILSLGLEWGYVFVFFRMLQTFLPLRRSMAMRVLAFFANSLLAVVIIYSNDLANLLGALLGFVAYVAVFHRGSWAERLTAVLVFYPALIAVNYLMMDMGSRLFFGVTDASGKEIALWTKEEQLASTAIHVATMLLRLLFWLGAWHFLRKYLRRIASGLTAKMWMVVDILMLSPFVAIFTIIYFMPEDPVIVYPICGASIFSSFGCIYLAAYICNSVQTAYRAQELEMKQSYYRDRMGDEERVRGIYHDLKNHLLVLQAQAGNRQEVDASIQGLQSQIHAYENYYHTGNEILDIIIRDKAKKARESQIDFSAAIALEDGAFIEPLDISTIFGNALDNAIEASQCLPQEERLITVKAGRIRDILVMSVENNALSETIDPERTTKEDAFAHGFGIPNIRKAVERYGGQCSVRAEEGRFVLKIMIPMP